MIIIIILFFYKENMRIVAGKHKGLHLKEFLIESTRPTTDKVREAIFNKLQFIVPNSTCLDLFGGTGAVTIEMLSRGAKSVTVCDNNQSNIILIKENCIKAKESPTIIKNDFKVCLKSFYNKCKFDIIFLDPPFNSGYGEIALKLINEYQLLNNDGVIVYECDKGTVVQMPSFKIVDTKNYGRIVVNYLKKDNDKNN